MLCTWFSMRQLVACTLSENGWDFKKICVEDLKTNEKLYISAIFSFSGAHGPGISHKSDTHHNAIWCRCNWTVFSIKSADNYELTMCGKNRKIAVKKKKKKTEWDSFKIHWGPPPLHPLPSHPACCSGGVWAHPSLSAGPPGWLGWCSTWHSEMAEASGAPLVYGRPAPRQTDKNNHTKYKQSPTKHWDFILLSIPI